MTRNCSRYTLSAFGDEAHKSFEKQVDVLSDVGIYQIDVRRIGDQNIIELSDDRLTEIKRTLTDRGFEVSMIGSPVGSISIEDDFDSHIGELERTIEVAHSLGTDDIRILSYMYPENSDPTSFTDEVISRTQAKVALAEAADVTLFLENVPGFVGEKPGIARDIMTSVDSPHLRLIFDAKSFVLSGERAYPDALLDLIEFVDCVHVADVTKDEGRMVLPGDGDAEIESIFQALFRREYTGFITLEPHLSLDDRSQGLSGPIAFRRAVDALQEILARIDSSSEHQE